MKPKLTERSERKFVAEFTQHLFLKSVLQRWQNKCWVNSQTASPTIYVTGIS